MRLYDDIVVSADRAIARSYAKINLTLDVNGKRADGYHDVCMIMQSISLFDLVIVDREQSDIRLSCNLKYLPCDERNLAYKAAARFFEECGINGGARILIHKNIPVAAGLAGGSGNAAAVLCALNMLYNTHLSDAELCKMGLALGADVPFCIMGGTQLAEGIGERLSAIGGLPKLTVLLVKPPVNVSTAQIYDELDSAKGLVHPDTRAVIKAIENADTQGICAGLSNIMESVTAARYPEIEQIKAQMLDFGAAGAVMSGSGPTVFGIFEDVCAAKRACDSFGEKYQEVFLAKTYN